MKRSILAFVALALLAVPVAGPALAQSSGQSGSMQAKDVPVAAAPAAGTGAPAATTPATAKPAQPTSGKATKDAGKAAPAAVDSLAILEKAVAKDSTKFDNLYRLGVMYLDRDRVNEASRVLLKAHQLKPKNHKVLVNLGAAMDAAGSPAQAQVYYKQALALAPKDSVATCRLASSFYAQAKYSDALDLLRGMIDEKTGTGAYCAYFTLGVAFADAGIYRDAIRMWQKVVALAPDSPEANSAKESIEVLQKFVNK